MNTCFVIQPFDAGVFDQRYFDVFEPAIRSAELDPYRVDRDPAVRTPIDQIEDGIKKARICFAEITCDNPNVWYELGFAFASSKDVVMVCSEERKTKFPFDIQHKSIITYKTTSRSDYDVLEKKIIDKLVAYLNKQQKIQSIIDNPVHESEGLKPHEVTLLLILLENQITAEDFVSAYSLQSDMEKAGFTKAACNIAIRELQRKEMIDTFKVEENYQQSEYLGCRLTNKGEDWLLQNQDKIEFRKRNNTRENYETKEDLPF